MQIVTLIQSAKEFVPIAAFVAMRSFNKGQIKLGKQQLRHKLYDRRLRIYRVFRELLQGLSEKGEGDIKAAFQRARVALLEVPFLFKDPELHAYLEEICTRVADTVINNTVDMTPKPADILYNSRKAEEAMQRGRQYEAAKLQIQQEYLPRLPGKFGAFLNLTDYLK
jgi:hypothetical protein